MIEILLNGVTSGKGFLVTSKTGIKLQGELTLQGITGKPVEVQLRTGAGSHGQIEFEATSVQVAEVPIIVPIWCSDASDVLNDTIVEVCAESLVIATLNFTVVREPTLRLTGRFQCRLATDPDPFDHQWGNASSFGSYSVRGPDVANPNEPPLDRIVRFNDPVGVRPFAPDVGVSVVAIEAKVGGSIVRFTTGDVIIGEPAFLGSRCVFEAQDDRFAPAGYEPISNFELTLGATFSGKSATALPRLKETDPPPSTAPYADGFYKLDEIGPWKPSDFNRGEANWKQYGEAVVAEKQAQLTAQSPANDKESRIRERRLMEHTNNLNGMKFALACVERYSGIIDQELVVNPGKSMTMAYLASVNKYAFWGEFLAFDTDTHTGYFTGTVGTIAETDLTTMVAHRVAPSLRPSVLP